MRISLLPALATLALIVPGFAAAHPNAHVVAAAEAATPAASAAKVSETKAAMRDLWIGHVFWVRNVVVARLADDDARAKVSEQQVVANAKAIAGVIEPFYGEAASEKLFDLLAGHWQAISDYFDATDAGNKAGQDAAFQKLNANADEIAVFLSGANPHLPVATLRSVLTAHGAHHVQQIQQLKAQRYADEARTWSTMTGHMYVIADALVDGISAQFPDKFR